MAMSILFRNDPVKNQLRDALLELVESEGKGDEIIISSGYITKWAVQNNDPFEVFPREVP